MLNSIMDTSVTFNNNVVTIKTPTTEITTLTDLIVAVEKNTEEGYDFSNDRNKVRTKKEPKLEYEITITLSHDANDIWFKVQSQEEADVIYKQLVDELFTIKEDPIDSEALAQ